MSDVLGRLGSSRGNASNVNRDTPVKVSIKGVTRTFQGSQTVKALGPVDLDIHEGEFACVVGPSGCGKSTLLKILSRLIRPSSGEVEIFPCGRGPLTATVFQEYSIFPWRTVADNVRFGLDAARIPRRQSEPIVQQLLEQFRLADFANARPGQLSGGMRQRVSIARAYAIDPEILLMDEPFAALDAQLRRLMQEDLLALWEGDRRTVVFITHSLDEAILLGDRVFVMSSRPGTIVATHTVPFARPRTGDLRETPEFGQLAGTIWNELMPELPGTAINSPLART